MTTSQQPQET
uniref:Uncharacterized protein n=1 Tax=Arundo donax TaxID=35708 RepID=A0A0A8Z759_ARUDO